jgi:DNA-binding MarR family transcriptional regulator
MMALMSDEPAAVTAAARVDDPTEVSRWRPVFRLLSDMDDEIGRVYADNGIEDLKPTWVLEIVRLHARGPMTIAELARSVGRTHSALSQKVAAMRAAGWLATSPGRDARSKQVTLIRVARDRGRAHRTGSRTPITPDPGSGGHQVSPGRQVLPRPHHRAPVGRRPRHVVTGRRKQRRRGEDLAGGKRGE